MKFVKSVFKGNSQSPWSGVELKMCQFRHYASIGLARSRIRQVSARVGLNYSVLHHWFFCFKIFGIKLRRLSMCLVFNEASTFPYLFCDVAGTNDCWAPYRRLSLSY